MACLEDGELIITLHMFTNLFIFVVSLFLVVKGATLSTKYAARLAESFHLSKYTVGFIVIAVISVLPETFISVNAALEDLPSFGLGLLFGSNIADLTLLFAAVIFLAGRGLKIESNIVKKRSVFPFMLLLPLILGLNGHFSRLEGAALVLSGGVFYYLALKDGIEDSVFLQKGDNRRKNLLWLLFSLAVMLVGTHFTVVSAVSLAGDIGINPVLIGMLVVSIGTTMPEFIFSLKAVKKRDDSLAVGDILGTVLADATIVVGILALVNPFTFSPKIIYVTGLFMVAASLILFRFMKSGRVVSKREAAALLGFWLTFIVVEFFINR